MPAGRVPDTLAQTLHYCLRWVGGSARCGDRSEADADAAAALAELLAARARADAAGGAAAARAFVLGQVYFLENLLGAARWADPAEHVDAPRTAAWAAADAATAAAARAAIAAGPARGPNGVDTASDDGFAVATVLLALAVEREPRVAWADGRFQLLDAHLAAAFSGSVDCGDLDACLNFVAEFDTTTGRSGDASPARASRCARPARPRALRAGRRARSSHSTRMTIADRA